MHANTDSRVTADSHLHPSTRLLRLKEVRGRLRVSNTTLHEFWKVGSRYYREDMPKKFYIGRTPYVRECDLDAFILANMQNVIPETISPRDLQAITNFPEQRPRAGRRFRAKVLGGTCECCQYSALPHLGSYAVGSGVDVTGIPDIRASDITDFDVDASDCLDLF